MGRGGQQDPSHRRTASRSQATEPIEQQFSLISREGREVPITVYGDIDPKAIEQLMNCAREGSAVAAALMPDGHLGYSQPIGGVVAYEHHISPSGAGYDLGCGLMGVRTDIQAADVDYEAVMEEITRRISFGMGQPNKERVDHPVLDEIANADFTPQRKLAQLAASQLGTVGAGNHFISLAEDTADGSLWVTCHFGSRGFGHKTASGFLAMAAEDAARRRRHSRNAEPIESFFETRAREGEMMSPPVLLDTREDLGQAYVAAQELASRYAYAGREVVCAKVCEILGARVIKQINEHHNGIWREHHGDRDVWVVRKGATPAFPGQQGVVGGSMEYGLVVVEGLDGDQRAATIHSTMHGAGRVMSRTKAAGRVRRRKVYRCKHRDCDYEIPARDYAEHKAECPRHGASAGFERLIRTERVKEGAIDYEAVRARLARQGVVLVGGAADEAPEVYRNLGDVLAQHRDHVTVRHRLIPRGVAMAGPDTFDAYKD